MKEFTRFVVLSTMLSCFLGCGGAKVPPLVSAEGTIVDQDGNPLDLIRVTFMPDPEKENFGRSSSGDSDKDGNFILYYDGNKEVPGVAVGANRVILTDLKAARTSRDPDPEPIRIHGKYFAANSTDLIFNVKNEDGQKFELKVDSPK